ncbi:MAG: hypothetical protein AB1571_00045 [Nanoarchaeota archaeon]
MKPEICENCLRWKEFKGKCRYYWQNKKECGSKVKTVEEMLNLDRLRFEGRV